MCTELGLGVYTYILFTMTSELKGSLLYKSETIYYIITNGMSVSSGYFGLESA